MKEIKYRIDVEYVILRKNVKPYVCEGGLHRKDRYGKSKNRCIILRVEGKRLSR